MRAHPSDYELVTPRSLSAVLSLLAQEPGVWLPIAGGTDIMVQYAAGKLAARKLVSIWNLPELRCIEVFPDEIQIGAGCTYTDLSEHIIVNREFTLLSRAARWTGGIANQNRQARIRRIGGKRLPFNILGVNCVPAGTREMPADMKILATLHYPPQKNGPGP